jgi:hypothetical protein
VRAPNGNGSLASGFVAQSQELGRIPSGLAVTSLPSGPDTLVRTKADGIGSLPLEQTRSLR